MAFPYLAVAVGLSAIGSIFSSSKASSANRRASAAASRNAAIQAQITREQLAFQKDQAAKLEVQKGIYRNFKFSNPYQDMQNMYEDLTVSTKAADFQMRQGQQQRSNILGGLRGAAGSSGIAGLAQVLANQGQVQAQQASISISQQEQQNQKLERQAAAANDMAFRGGEAAVEQQEMSRQATLLGVAMGGMSGANAGVQAAYANQMSANANQANLYGQQGASYAAQAGSFANTALTLGAGLGG